MKFEKKKLGDICSYLRSGKSLSSKLIFDAGDYPVYGGNGCRGFTISPNYKGECAIIGRQGAYCGNVRYFNGDAYFTEHAIIATANKENNTRYLSYLLSLMNLGSLSSQSAQPGLAVTTLSQLELDIPSLDNQTKIVNILSPLDEKIFLNNKINDNLAA